MALAAATAWMLLGSAVACGDAAQEPAVREVTPPPDATPAEATPAPVDPAEGAGGAAAGELPGDVSDLDDVSDGLQPQAEPPAQDSYWLLTEFDWGDDREVVYESTRFDPFYTCHRKSQGICALTQVKVDAEDLLAQFHFDADDRLFQMVFLTPDLDRPQADAHLRRVWQVLADYVTRHKGEPESAAELPDLDALELGPPQQTHLWRAEGLEVRLRVGRRDTDVYYVGAFFSDPAQTAAREAHDAGIAASDRLFRERRAEQAAQPPRRPPGAADTGEAPASGEAGDTAGDDS